MRERVRTLVARSEWVASRARVRVQTKEKEGKWKFRLGFPKDCNSKKSLNHSRPLCSVQFTDADRRRLQTFHTHILLNLNGMPIEGIDAVSSRSEKEKNLKWQMLPAFSGKALWSPGARPHPPVRRAFGLVLLEYAAHASRTAPLTSAHKKMSDELLAQYRRGAHIRTRSPWKDMDTAMGMPNTQKLSARRKAQHVRTAGGVLCKTNDFSFV